MTTSVRQWSDHVFAVYVELGEKYPTFVGTESTRLLAERHAERVLADPAESSKRRCVTTGSVGVCGVPETMLVGELGCAPSGSASTLVTAGRLAPLTHQEPGLIIAAPTDICTHGTPITGA